MPDSGIADGTVLTSSFYDTYIRQQVVEQVTSATRPTGVEGRIIYETDTDTFQCYNGTSWVEYGRLGNWAGSTPTLTNVTGGTVAMQSMRIGKALLYCIQITAGTATAAGTVTITTGFTSAAVIQPATALLSVGGVVQTQTSCRWEASSTSLTLYKTAGNFALGDSVICRINGIAQLA